MEFSKRFTTDEVWPAEILDANPDYRGKTLFDVLFRNGKVDRFPLSEIDPEYENHEAKAFRLLSAEGPVRGICRRSAAATATTSRPSTRYHEVRGLRWPVVDGKETRWRYREGLDPYVKPGEGVRVLRQARRQGGDPRRALRAAGGSRRTTNTTSGW